MEDLPDRAKVYLERMALSRETIQLVLEAQNRGKFAAEAHNGQLVTGSTLPYLMHIGMVAMEITAALSV